MTIFRLYRLDGRGKIAGPPERVEAETDEAGLDIARMVSGGQACELWERNRLVGHLAATRAASEHPPKA